LDKKHLEKQFTDKVRTSQGIIHKVCHMYGKNEEHRKDLFQEIMVQLWRSFPSFRGEAKFSTWMYRVALNVAIQDFRNTKKKKELFSSLTITDVADDLHSEDQEEKLQLLHKAIANLNKVERAIVMLHLEGKMNEEIADIIGITQNYVRVKMNRIKTKLSKTLTEK